MSDTLRVPEKKVPLTTLLSWVWIAHAIEVDNAFEAAGSERAGRVRISLPMWTNGLRFVDEDGVTFDELRTRARAACNIGGLERWGWISVGETVGTKRRDGYGSHRGVKGETVLRPTSAGTFARRLWPDVLGDVEQRWRTRFGGDVVDELGDTLRTVVTSMPWSPPEVASSDGFYTHVVAGDAVEQRQRPLAALLGQVLTAFTLDHEEQAEVSLPVGGNVLRVIGSDVVLNRDLPALTGISKEGIAMAVGYLQRRGLATSTPERTISLTPDGLDALDGYWHRSARPKDNRLRDALTAIVAQPDALSVGLVPPEGCWRGERPYLAQTQRLVANPTAALPWHPMVTSRAGWPDAS